MKKRGSKSGLDADSQETRTASVLERSALQAKINALERVVAEAEDDHDTPATSKGAATSAADPFREPDALLEVAGGQVKRKKTVETITDTKTSFDKTKSAELDRQIQAALIAETKKRNTRTTEVVKRMVPDGVDDYDMDAVEAAIAKHKENAKKKKPGGAKKQMHRRTDIEKDHRVLDHVDKKEELIADMREERLYEIVNSSDVTLKSYKAGFDDGDIVEVIGWDDHGHAVKKQKN